MFSPFEFCKVLRILREIVVKGMIGPDK